MKNTCPSGKASDKWNPSLGPTLTYGLTSTLQPYQVQAPLFDLDHYGTSADSDTWFAAAERTCVFASKDSGTFRITMASSVPWFFNSFGCRMKLSTSQNRPQSHRSLPTERLLSTEQHIIQFSVFFIVYPSICPALESRLATIH